MDWNQIITAALGSAALVLAATLPVLLSQRKLVREVHNEVKNTHESNLREDIDEGFRKVEAAAKEALRAASRSEKVSQSHTRRLDRISKDVGRISEQVASTQQRLDDHIDGR